MDHGLQLRCLFHILKGKNQLLDSLTWDYCRYILGLKHLFDSPYNVTKWIIVHSRDSLRSKRFRLVSEQRKTEEVGILGFGRARNERSAKK